MTDVVGGRFSLGAFDHFEAMVGSSDSMAVARRAAVLVIGESFELDMVNLRTFTDDGSSVRIVLSNFAQIFGTVSIMKTLATLKVPLVVTKQ